MPPGESTGRRGPPTAILVHGGFLGAWIWEDVVAALEAEGVCAVTLDLPSVKAHAGGEVGDFYADARAGAPTARRGAASDRALRSLRGRPRDHGGRGPGPHPAVRRLVYLTAAIPDAGDTMASLMADATGGAEQPDAGAEPVVMRPDGLADLDPEQAEAALFHDCDPARAKAAVNRPRPMNMAGGTQPLTGAAWRELPATLVRGTLDRMPEAIAPAFFEGEPEVVEIPTGHCPTWSRPELVAEVLASRAAAL